MSLNDNNCIQRRRNSCRYRLFVVFAKSRYQQYVPVTAAEFLTVPESQEGQGQVQVHDPQLSQGN